MVTVSSDGGLVDLALLALVPLSMASPEGMLCHSIVISIMHSLVYLGHSTSVWCFHFLGLQYHDSDKRPSDSLDEQVYALSHFAGLRKMKVHR